MNKILQMINLNKKKYNLINQQKFQIYKRILIQAKMKNKKNLKTNRFVV